MAEYKSISVAEIVVPERIRPVDEGHAQAIARSIKGEGLLNPITVRHTPNASGGNYTLIAGAHRLRAVEMNGDHDIDAIIVKADKDAAQLLEVSENLFRNDLSVIDRALFVQTFRELWEKQHGEITRGGDQKAKGQLAPLGSDGEPLTFSKHVSDRLGLSKDAIKRLGRICQNLNPDLRNALRETAVADNQAQLLKLAKLEPSKQRQAAAAFRDAHGDYSAAMALIDDRPDVEKPDPQAMLLSKAIECIGKMTPETLAQFSAYFTSLKDDDRRAA